MRACPSAIAPRLGLAATAAAALLLGPVQAGAGWSVAVVAAGGDPWPPALWLLGLTAARAVLQTWSSVACARQRAAAGVARTQRWSSSLMQAGGRASPGDLVLLQEGDVAVQKAVEMAGLGLGAVLVAAWAHPWMGFIAGGTLVAGMLAAAWGVRSVAGRLLRGLRQEWAGERRPGADAAALVADRATAAAQAQGREACRRRALAVQLVAGAGLLVLTGVGAVLMRSGSLGVGACIGLLLAATTATMRCEGIAPVIGGLAAASIGRRRLERLPAAAPAVRPAVPAVPRRIPCPA